MSVDTVIPKRRVANIIAGFAIVATFSMWAYTIVIAIGGGVTVADDSLLISPVMAFVTTVLGFMNGVTGFAAKYLWDSANTD